jgi:hypothetical protein
MDQNSFDTVKDFYKAITMRIKIGYNQGYQTGHGVRINMLQSRISKKVINVRSKVGYSQR